ncbi:hypothetical protein Tco_0115156 [Tanacetum coccineum]
MKRAGKDFSKRITPLFDTIMVQASEEVGDDSDHLTDSNQIPIIDQPSTSSHPKMKQKSKKTQRKEAKVPQDETEHEETQVLDLETAKDAQAKEIVALKKRVQGLERKKKSRTTGLKRLKKVSMSRRVESSKDQESLGDHKDASKQGRSIKDIDKDADVTLVDETQERQDDDLMFDIGVLDTDEMHVEAKIDEKDEQSTKLDDSTAGEAVTTASVEGSAAPTTIEEITLAQTLIQIKAAKPKVGTTATTTAATITTTTRPKARGVVVQDLKEEKLARKQEEEANIALIESWENTQAMIEADRLLAERLQTREKEELTDEEKGKLNEKNEEGSEEKAKGSRKKMLGRKRAGKEQQQESSKKQRMEEDKESNKVEEDDEAELKKHLVIKKDEDIEIDVIPLATKPPMIIDYKLHKEGMMVHYQLIRADGSSKRYSLMIRMLQDIDREDLLTLWKLVKTKHYDIRPEDKHERVMWGDFKVMFEPAIRSKVWRDLEGYTVTVWKLYDSCRVHFVRFRNVHIFMLVEKRYPLTPITITNILNKKLQTDHFSEMCYQLLKFMVKQQKGQKKGLNASS